MHCEIIKNQKENLKSGFWAPGFGGPKLVYQSPKRTGYVTEFQIEQELTKYMFQKNFDFCYGHR